VNPCTVCNVCSLGLCIGDSTQNGNTCDTSRVCCEGLCCNVGDICPGFDTAQVGPAAVATCCTPSGCPAGNLGDLCGTGVPDLNCGTIVPGSCACTAGVCDETLGTCCLPDGVGSACGTNGALCCSGVCNSQGYCGCVIEGSECSTGDTCCAGGTYECNGFACTQF
jgi:hypothetical protein